MSLLACSSIKLLCSVSSLQSPSAGSVWWCLQYSVRFFGMFIVSEIKIHTKKWAVISKSHKKYINVVCFLIKSHHEKTQRTVFSKVHKVGYELFSVISVYNLNHYDCYRAMWSEKKSWSVSKLSSNGLIDSWNRVPMHLWD